MRVIFNGNDFDLYISFFSILQMSKERKMNENLLSEKKKWVASLLVLFLGMMGIHRFYLGRNASGAVMLVVFVLGVLIPIVGCA